MTTIERVRMPTYRNEQHAAVRAMAVDAISTAATSSWQKQHQPGFVESETQRVADCDQLSPAERLSQDCMTRALIHDALAPAQWWLLVALYSANDRERAKACEELAGSIQTPADALFKGMAIGTYVFPKVRKEAKSITHWTLLEDAPERTLRRWRKDIHIALEALRKSAMIHLQRVLKDAGLIEVD